MYLVVLCILFWTSVLVNKIDCCYCTNTLTNTLTTLFGYFIIIKICFTFTRIRLHFTFQIFFFVPWFSIQSISRFKSKLKFTNFSAYLVEFLWQSFIFERKSVLSFTITMCISLCFWKHDTPLLNFIINFAVNEILKIFLLQVNLLDIVISSTCTLFMSLRL